MMAFYFIANYCRHCGSRAHRSIKACRCDRWFLRIFKNKQKSKNKVDIASFFYFVKCSLLFKEKPKGHAVDFSVAHAWWYYRHCKFFFHTLRPQPNSVSSGLRVEDDWRIRLHFVHSSSVEHSTFLYITFGEHCHKLAVKAFESFGDRELRLGQNTLTVVRTYL